MDIESFREYCIEKKGVTEEFPFGPDTLVFKVMGKMFALTGLDNYPFRVNLKCDPDYAEELRERYEEVTPGYHMNKKLWNTVVFEPSTIKDPILRKWIDDSYTLIIASLPKKLKIELESL
ncbi:MAG: MmcQ/YjbR family DNA-binding protein [Chitinophagales bacterium]|nr:MmcQ/YjbR family DNA-binding protein [Chitinophagales bacterium]